MSSPPSPRLADALACAIAVHGGEIRRATGTSRIAHALAVASFVLDHGGDEDQAAAALLHDVAETGGRARLEEIRARFGERAARIVEACTGDEPEPGRWADRERLSARARDLPADARLVVAAEAVHDAYTILRSLRTEGDAIWRRLGAAPDDVVWHYRALARALREAGGGPLVDELERVVRGLERELGY
ncbi:MAG TPA: HD domain-containing protein [Vicinamibacterales bacterium]|nr:HD domain-containing protein [Vicinamibacterales bacterium]